MVSERIIMDLLAKVGISAAAKSLMSSILPSLGNYLNARSLVRFLNSSDSMIGYLIYHVTKVLKIRAIHSSESDVYIDDIY